MHEGPSERTLEGVEPIWLVVVLRGEDAGVEEDKDDDKPVEPLRLDRRPARLAKSPVVLLQPMSAYKYIVQLENASKT